MSKNEKSSMKCLEGEYGEIYNTKRNNTRIDHDDLDDIEDKIIIINPTNKDKK
ncbi:hypothetical protein [Inediibacterium massiliense]|uniref:hypothetical protein n=1 Tax=Inediibacterium massiliense TaxID=1658111 RepID=UPI0018FE955A|nr:hypothetical protein [Inediibacterium massiliense]